MMRWAGVQDLHGALLARMLRPPALQPASVADVAIDVRHACLTEAYDCFCAAVAATVSLTSSASSTAIHQWNHPLSYLFPLLNLWLTFKNLNTPWSARKWFSAFLSSGVVYLEGNSKFALVFH